MLLFVLSRFYLFLRDEEEHKHHLILYIGELFHGPWLQPFIHIVKAFIIVIFETTAQRRNSDWVSLIDFLILLLFIPSSYSSFSYLFNGC